MAEEAGREKPLSIEAEFAHLVKFSDLYIRQKIDLYIQHYLFEPFEFLVRQLVYLSVLAALLVAGTLAILIGVILFVSTLVPLWEALLIIGIIALIVAGIVAYVLFSSHLILKTPTTEELMKHGSP
jgi:uncharacterized membrane protein